MSSQTFAGHVRVNNGGLMPAALTIERDIQEQWTNLPRRDPSWSHIDSNGHFHAYAYDAGSDRYPTLRAEVEVLPCDDADHDDECEGVHKTRWFCLLCGEEVSPGLIQGPHSFTVEGRLDWWIEVDGYVEPACEQVTVRFAPAAGGVEFFAVGVTLQPRGHMPEVGDGGPRFVTQIRAAGPLGRRIARMAGHPDYQETWRP